MRGGGQKKRGLAVQARRQRAILQGAAGAVRRGGRLVYSVCTNEPEETEDVVSSFHVSGFIPMRDGGTLPQSARHLLGMDGALRVRPGMGMDGFFAMGWRNEG